MVTLVTHGERREVNRVMSEAGIRPTVTQVRSGEESLTAITGAKRPLGRGEGRRPRPLRWPRHPSGPSGQGVPQGRRGPQGRGSPRGGPDTQGALTPGPCRALPGRPWHVRGRLAAWPPGRRAAGPVKTALVGRASRTRPRPRVTEPDQGGRPRMRWAAWIAGAGRADADHGRDGLGCGPRTRVTELNHEGRARTQCANVGREHGSRTRTTGRGRRAWAPGAVGERKPRA